MNAPDIDAAPVSWAIYLAEHGQRMIPLRPHGKEPVLTNWPNAGTTDTTQICAWADEEPERNFGIVTTGLVVIDIDPARGGLVWLEEHEFDLPETWRFRTGSGGLHIIFKAPPGRPIGNRTGMAPGVDIKAHHGQIVAPGSIHPNGGQYQIEIGPDDCDLADAPQWLIDMIQQQPDTINGQQPNLNEGPIEKGYRDDTLTKIAGHLIKTLSYSDARAQLHKINQERCKPPLPGKAVNKIINSISKAETQKPEHTPPDLPIGGKIITAAAFAASRIPPRYLIQGVLQRGYLYALTANTGHGKTAVLLLLCFLVAIGRYLGHLRVRKGRVVFCAGENPDDPKGRTIVTAAAMNVDLETLDLHFVDGAFDLESTFGRIREQAQALGGVDLIVLETHAAFFDGDDENSNAQQLAFAKRARRLTELPGHPTVVVSCHPIKKATRDNLLPKGGSSFVNEVDGNLTLWSDDYQTTELHWFYKFRGPEFEPLSFDLKKVLSDKLLDDEGEPMWSVYAAALSDTDVAERKDEARSDEDQVLLTIKNNPRRSYREYAELLNWTYSAVDGTKQPAKSRVQRAVERLKAAKLVKSYRRELMITDAGKKEADAIAKQGKLQLISEN